MAHDGPAATFEPAEQEKMEKKVLESEKGRF